MSNIGSRTDAPVLAVTAGEPVGVGADLCLSLAARQPPSGARVVILADKNLLRQRAEQLGMVVTLRDYETCRAQPFTSGHLVVSHVPLAQPTEPGKLNAANSRYVLALLDRAAQGCLSGEFDGMVTAPVHKGIINDAGIPFTGHTEFLAERTNTAQVVMMLVGGGMRVALATTHLPLRAVPDALTATLLESVLRIIHRDLARRFGIAHPRILVAGLNPHAGESGHMGREEIDVMIPTLEKLRAEGMAVSLPLPADTLFTPQRLAQCDCVLAMYHDQGLPVLKHASFGNGVNVTLGLPIIRTSVDHGTALELAGTGRADPSSLFEAIETAAQMAGNSCSASRSATR
ncbi:MAG: 4-hydroxythreonine-4-phosphate dehydrogenase PdxA [Gallionellaceae bacterium]|jgi:4-hydroxythreonine-4-phosphate dehydrogenase|nr:4-hydroxythreonine-4-phosphate dehydrogenase PdxA [Gallionellaceae bacterium]